MKVSKRQLLVTVPSLALVAGVVFFGVDSLTVHSTGAPAKLPMSATSQTITSVSSSPTPSPSTQPVTQPTPAGPSPKATVAAVRTGNLLTIPSIGLNASVVDVGLTATNAIDVPAGLQVGYWTGSAQPGMPGATFLDGHVDGIFAHLDRLGVGQTFSIRFNGQTFRYQVAHTETVALAGIDMNRALSTYGGAPEGLNMMTCAGIFVPSLDTYDQRFVVYAVRIG